jgi:hypothetical protein
MALKKKTTGIYRTLPASLVFRERLDAIQFERSLDSVHTAATEHWFKLPIKFRKSAYDSFPVKIMGRKVTQ